MKPFPPPKKEEIYDFAGLRKDRTGFRLIRPEDFYGFGAYGAKLNSLCLQTPHPLSQSWAYGCQLSEFSRTKKNTTLYFSQNLFVIID